MGQLADQEMKSGNRAVVIHEDERRSVRLFRGGGGDVTYLGEFRLVQRQSYRMDAQETGGDQTRQVIVFRLLPVGIVIHDVGDELRLRERSARYVSSTFINRRSRVSTGSRATVRTRFAAPATR